MKVTVEIELDDTWEEYFFIPSTEVETVYLNDTKADSFLEDLFSNWNKDGVENVKIVKINK